MQPPQTAGDQPAPSVYARVTDQVLAELAKGTAPWRRPWRVEFGLPRNLDSRKPYRGVNVLTLMTAALGAGHGSNWWLTFNQARQHGGHVDKGAHGLPVVFYDRTPAVTTTEYDAHDELHVTTTRWRPVLRIYTVFNVGQCAGIPVPEMPRLAWQPIAAAERITDALGVPVHYQGVEAFYHPQGDAITVPPRAFFDDETGFYGTLLHEAVHATAHESRLHRPFGAWGSEAYAWEELVAEMGSAMLSVIVGVPAPDYPNVAAYIEAWRTRMERDAQAIAEAAAAAQKAVEWLLTAADLPLPQ
jgi:antirestriction protein ArdC